MKMVENQCPDLLLLDYGLVGTSTVLQRLNEKCPESQNLVMAHDVDQQRKAQVAGAGVVVLIGVTPSELASIVTDLVRISPS